MLTNVYDNCEITAASVCVCVGGVISRRLHSLFQQKLSSLVFDQEYFRWFLFEISVEVVSTLDSELSLTHTEQMCVHLILIRKSVCFWFVFPCFSRYVLAFLRLNADISPPFFFCFFLRKFFRLFSFYCSYINVL